MAVCNLFLVRALSKEKTAATRENTWKSHTRGNEYYYGRSINEDEKRLWHSISARCWRCNRHVLLLLHIFFDNDSSTIHSISLCAIYRNKYLALSCCYSLLHFFCPIFGWATYEEKWQVQGLLQTFRQVQEERTTPQSSYQSWSCHIGFVGMVCTNLVLPPLTDAITSFSPFCKSSNHVKRYWKQNILFNLLQRYLSEVIFNNHIIAFNYQTTSFLPSRMYIPRAGLACSWRPWRSKRVWRPDELGECGLSIPAGFVSTTCRPESSWVCDVLRQKWGKNRLLDVI